MMSRPLSIEVVIRDIRDLKADVCVSSIYRTKNLSTGVLASAMKERAGTKVQDELLKSGSGKELQHGEVVLTSPGNLGSHFQQLMFVSLYRWQEGNDKTLREVVTKCLEKTSSSKFRSIAFPALGMGGLHYPAAKVARSIMSAIIEFSQNYTDSSVDKVYIALYDKNKDNIRTFFKTSTAYITTLELERSMSISQSLRSSLRAQDHNIQGGQSGEQILFAGNRTAFIRHPAPALSASASLSQWNVNGDQLIIDLSRLLSRPVNLMVDNTNHFV